MSDHRADRNRRKREQTRARYDTPREDGAPSAAQRRLQLAANLCQVPATALPPLVTNQIWELRHELLVALDAAGVRADAAAPLASTPPASSASTSP